MDKHKSTITCLKDNSVNSRHHRYHSWSTHSASGIGPGCETAGMATCHVGRTITAKRIPQCTLPNFNVDSADGCLPHVLNPTEDVWANPAQSFQERHDATNPYTQEQRYFPLHQ